MSADKRLCLHFTPEWLKSVIIFRPFYLFFSPPLRSCQSCYASRTRCSLRHPEQVDDKAAYTFPLIAGSQRIVSEMKMMTRARGGSQSSARPEPKCFKWITPVCHCDYTLLAATATRWIVFYGFAADPFSLFSVSPPVWMYFSLSPHDEARSECGIVFLLWTTSQSFHLLCFLKGTFSVYLTVKWLAARPCICMNFHAS